MKKQEEQKPLAQVIIDTAKPRIPEGGALSPSEHAFVAHTVEQEARSVVKDLKPNDNRAAFIFNKDFLKGIRAHHNLLKFKNNPVKQKAAISLATSLARDWEALIQRSEMIKYTLVSAQEFAEELKG